MDPYFSLYTKINSKWIKDLNTRTKIIKNLEQGKTFMTLDSTMRKVQATKEKNHINPTLSKFKTFVHEKTLSIEGKINVLNGRTYLQTMFLMRS